MARTRDEHEGGLVYRPVDTAGRIALPAHLAAQFKGRAYLLNWTVPCLRLVAVDKLDEVTKALLATFDDPRQREWIIRRTVATKRLVAIDDSNRVRIPGAYLDCLKVPNEGRRLLVLDFEPGIVELWHPDTYRSLVMGVDFTAPYWPEVLHARIIGVDDPGVLVESLRARVAADLKSTVADQLPAGPREQ